MNRIDIKFADLKAQGKKALITFITAGDPDFDTTEKLVYELINSGVDIIELGVPFSDPVAEGPIIQAASARSLLNNTNLNDIFTLVDRLRQNVDLPILLMMYINSIYSFGKDNFFYLCSKVGIDGVIVPDLPFEERFEISVEADKYGIYSISLVAPTSSDRIKSITEESKGFLYCVSSLGVTGTRSNFTTDFDEFFSTINMYSEIPTAIGFGISSPDQVAALKKYADGVIIGSAIVKIIGHYGSDCVEPVGCFVKELKAALL